MYIGHKKYSLPAPLHRQTKSHCRFGELLYQQHNKRDTVSAFISDRWWSACADDKVSIANTERHRTMRTVNIVYDANPKTARHGISSFVSPPKSAAISVYTGTSLLAKHFNYIGVTVRSANSCNIRHLRQLSYRMSLKRYSPLPILASAIVLRNIYCLGESSALTHNCICAKLIRPTHTAAHTNKHEQIKH